MKNLSFLFSFLVIIALFPNQVCAQHNSTVRGGKTSFDMSLLKTGKEITFTAKNGRRVLSTLTMTGKGKGAVIEFDFGGIGAESARIEFYKNGRLLTSYNDKVSNGPNGKLTYHVEDVEQLLYSRSIDKDEWYQVLLIVIALCCDFDVSYSSGSGWNGSAGCDCGAAIFSADDNPALETALPEFDEIRIIPNVASPAPTSLTISSPNIPRI